MITAATAPRSVRIAWPDKTRVEVWIQAKGESKCSVAVQHVKLAQARDAAAMKTYWKNALGKLAGIAA